MLLVLEANEEGVIWAVNCVHSLVRFENEADPKEVSSVVDWREAVIVGEEDELAVLAQKERSYVQLELTCMR